MKLSRTISIVILAFLVLMSSTSFMIGLHFCMGKVQNVALFTKAEACHNEKQKQVPPCHRQTETPCCGDQTVVHEGTEFKASIEGIQVEAPIPTDIEHFPVVIAEVIPSALTSRIYSYDYDPPLRSFDLTITNRVFLI